MGRWCLRYDRRSEWEPLKYSVLPCPWDDRDRFYEATRYLDELYERTLNQLAEYLNSVHCISHGQRYWRIMIGPWLVQYLHAVYDRYIHLTDAFSRNPELQTKMLDPGSFGVPRDTLDQVTRIRGDAYNLQVFSQLLQGMGYAFPEQTLNGGWPERAAETAERSNGWRGAAGDVGRRGLRLVEVNMGRVLGRRCYVGLCDMYLPRKLTWALAWRTALRAVPFGLKREWSFTIPGAAFDQPRTGLAALVSSDEFEGVFVRTLPQNFPTLYLEAFQDARVEIQRKYPRIPPVLTSVNGWDFNEPFKFLAAEAAEKGGRLVAAQHGGGYGIHRYTSYELHESLLSDSFMVWGWADREAEPCRNLPSPKLSSLLTGKTAKAGSRKDGPVLFIATSNPRYLHRFHSSPVGSQWRGYFEWQLRFLVAAPDRLRASILFRPHAVDYGHAIRERIEERFPHIHWDNGQPIYQRLKRCRMVVIDHPSTTFLETLAANVPTVLFWDPQRWEVRDEARPYFESLGEVGILWDSPEAAAAKVESVYDEPWDWWGDERLQEVRRDFVDRYALARTDWVSRWAGALEKEVALSRVTKQL